jgi:hypothetical protein
MHHRLLFCLMAASGGRSCLGAACLWRAWPVSHVVSDSVFFSSMVGISWATVALTKERIAKVFKGKKARKLTHAGFAVKLFGTVFGNYVRTNLL